METPPVKLSESEESMLRLLAHGELEPGYFDWIALQRLKQFGYAADRGGAPILTEQGRRALTALSNPPGPSSR